MAKARRTHTTHQVHRPAGAGAVPKAGGTDQLIFYGGLVAVAGLAAGAYFWMSSIQTQQQTYQQINSNQPQPQPASASSSAAAGGGPAILPVGTAGVSISPVSPLGFFSTIFPGFGGAQFLTLTRRTCDPYLGGIPTSADLASQGIVITSYQVNNLGAPYNPAVCGIPSASVTVGTTDPSSAAKLQALGFVPGGFNRGPFPFLPPFLGGVPPMPGAFAPPWQRPLLPGVPPYGIPPFGPTPPSPYPFLPTPKPWYFPRIPARFRPYRGKLRHKHHGGHHRSHPIRIVGFPKHNFVRPVGHVMNFDHH
jgi:hypothetical protein